MGSRNPTIQEVVSASIGRALFDLHTSIPCEVESFDKDKGTVDVRPMVKQRTRDEEGELQHVAFKTIRGVPVAWPGAGGFRFTFPISKGDPCHVIFNESDFGAWLQNGGEQSAGTGRRFNLNDGVAYFGLRSNDKRWTGSSTSVATLGKDGGPQAVFKDSEIHLGTKADDDATEALYLGSTHLQKIDTMIDSLKSNLQSAMTDLIQAAVQLGVAAGKNAVPMYGGAAAASDFGQVASKLGSVASSFGQIVGAITTYRSGGPYLSTKVKTK